jgi:hypothetical protein
MCAPPLAKLVLRPRSSVSVFVEYVRILSGAYVARRDDTAPISGHSAPMMLHKCST